MERCVPVQPQVVKFVACGKHHKQEAYTPLFLELPHEAYLVFVDVPEWKCIRRTLFCIEADRNALYHPDIVDGRILLEICKLDLTAFGINLDRRDRRWNLLHER